MNSDLLGAIGGLGLFLLGMSILTEGLRALAGRSLRRFLARFTRTPTSGAATGALVTALIQSSSATTVMAVGFVGAGLLTFAQALGIIFGANIGTTITGWLVALIGFKLDLQAAVLPLVLVGVLMRLLGRGRLRHFGSALAGFSLLFIGIAAMQDGLAAFEGAVTPDDFPGDYWLGRLQLVAIGIGITVITQSSSAGVATALVALDAGAISFPQAAAMVIGMDVGTTFTAALATLGGGTDTRRTGFAHVIYNLLTGVMALLLLDYYVAVVGPWIDAQLQGDQQIALVAFHTTFNFLGVLLVLPLTGAFARLIMWVVPDRGPGLTRRLDDKLLSDADAALDAATQTLSDVTTYSSQTLRRLIAPDEAGSDLSTELEQLERALDTSRRYIERIAVDPPVAESQARLRQTLHALDHLARLKTRFERWNHDGPVRDDHRLCRLAGALGDVLADHAPGARVDSRLDRLVLLLNRRREPFRARTLSLAARGRISSPDALARLDTYRWLLRVTEHISRASSHLHRAAEAAPGLV